MAPMEVRDTLKNTESERQEFAWRVAIAGAGVLALILVLIVRMLHLQVTRHEELVTRANENRLNLEIVPGVRGLIYDRQGVVLAENVPAYRLEITPEKVNDLEATINRLSGMLDQRK